MKRLGKYEILEEIGRGGFATVYKARDTTLDRIVALKVLHPHVADDPSFIQRFYQEARAAAQLRHPHIATVHEVGEEAGQHYLAMTFLPGQTLDRVLESAGGPLPLEQTVSIVEQVAGALDYIHSRGLVHRDVKPSNIIVDDAGQATLLDFGIVRAADGTQLTTTGAVMGTPQYMSPEQAQGLEVDHRSDVYSLGVVAYQMCTGQAPFDAVSPLVVLRLHADKAPPPPRTLNPKLPIEVERVLLKALAKRRAERYQSAGELALDLRQAVEPRVRAREQLHRLRPSVPSWTWIAGGVIVVLLIAFVGQGWRRWFAEEPTPTGTPTMTLTAPPTQTPTPTVTPRPARGDTWTRPVDGMVMVYVPAGEFEMGSEEGYDDEQPVHIVALDTFWIDQTEVTNAQYALCVADEACDESSLVDDAEFSGDNYPVVGVSWYDAVAYCEWAGARLPTEAEWEYAARGPEGYTYPWGDETPTCDRAQLTSCSGRTIPVGSLSDGASWCGALDLVGNVWEWVADWYGDYPSERQVNPLGSSSGEYRGLRGGSKDLHPPDLSSATRFSNQPGIWTNYIGFRCAKGSE